MAADGQRWRAASRSHSLGDFAHQRSNGTFTTASRSNSAVDMRQLTSALVEAREGTGEVRAILLRAAFKPRLPGLTKMVSKLSKEGAWRKALEVFEAVEDLGLVADTALTNSAISACDKGGRWQKALEIFESMARQGLPRDAITYSATISSLAKGKQWHAALQMFDHMQSNQIEADVVTCCSLINALERGGQWQLAEKLFLQMCTTQEEAEEEARSLLGTPPTPTCLLSPESGRLPLPRAQTSPSSVLDGLQSPPPRPLMMSISECPGRLDGVTPAGILAASIDILQSSATSRQGLGGLAGVVGGPKTPQAGEELTSNFASVALRDGATPSLDTLGILDAGCATISTPFDVASGFMGGLRKTSSSNSRSSFPDQIPEHEQAVFQPGTRADSSSLDAAHQPPPVLRRSGSGTSTAFGVSSPQRPGSGLARTGSLKRELGIPQLEAAASLRRAMSCCPALEGPEGVAQGADGKATAGLASMFNFSHAARVTPNRVCCNALLAAYARAKPPQYQRALHLLTAMWDGGPTLAPDGVSYNTVIKACANAFQVSRAMEVYREMVARGVRPSVTTFNCLITAASDSASYGALLEVGTWLRCSEADIRSNCMNAYVAGLVKVGHWAEALACFQEMLQPGSGVRPTASTFNTVMSGYMKAGQCDRVRGVYEEMLATGLTPSIVTYNTLLASFASLGAWAEALDALAHVRAAQAEGVNANMTTFNTCLAAVAKGADSVPQHQHSLVASRALQVYQQMQGASGCAPDAATHASLIRILDATQQYAQVVAVHEVMLQSSHSPDAATAGLVLKAAVAVGRTQKAFALAQSLQMQGVQLDPSLLTHLLGACLEAGAWDLALQLCSAALVAQGPAVAPLYNHVLQQAAAAGQFRVVVEVLTAMRAAGLEVDPEVAAMVMSSQASGGGNTASLPGLNSDASQAGACLPGLASLSSSPAGSMQHSPPAADGTWGASLAAPPDFTVQEVNALLEGCKSRVDAQGGLEVLTVMKQAGIQPDQATWSLAVELMAHAQEPVLAVQLCSEAHEAGSLQCYALPNLAGGAPPEGTALGNVLDLRRCGLELGVAVVLTWLIRCTQMRDRGLVVRDPCVKLITGQVPRQQAEGGRDGGDVGPGGSDPCGAALQGELLRTLTTGACSLAAFDGLSPVRLDPEAVSCTDDGTTILISTAGLYRGLATTSC